MEGLSSRKPSKTEILAEHVLLQILGHFSISNIIYHTPIANLKSMATTFVRGLLSLPTSVRCLSRTWTPFSRAAIALTAFRTFSSTAPKHATYNQVIRGCRQGQKARRATSPALANRPEMKGVCVRVGITKPKKPNSGERKVARVRLSSGTVITAYIPGEGRLHAAAGDTIQRRTRRARG